MRIAKTGSAKSLKTSKNLKPIFVYQGLVHEWICTRRICHFAFAGRAAEETFQAIFRSLLQMPKISAQDLQDVLTSVASHISWGWEMWVCILFALNYELQGLLMSWFIVDSYWLRMEHLKWYFKWLWLTYSLQRLSNDIGIESHTMRGATLRMQNAMRPGGFVTNNAWNPETPDNARTIRD